MENETETLAEIDFAILDKAFALANIDLHVNGDFVNLPYILLHEGNRFLVTDLNVEHPSELFQVGDKVKVKVLKFNSDSERVSLGLKQITAVGSTRRPASSE